FVPPICRHVSLAQKISPKFAVTDSDDKIFFGEAEGTKDVNAERDQLDICREIGFADDVAIQLKMLSEATALLFFVPEELPDGKPFEGFLEFAFVRSDYSSKRRREFWPQRDFAFAFVGKIKKLIDNFSAALFLV